MRLTGSPPTVTYVLAYIEELLSVSVDLLMCLCIQFICLDVVLLAFLGVRRFSLLLNLLLPAYIGYLLLFLLVTECVLKFATLFSA